MFVAVPPTRVASSRLIGRITHAVMARGWALDSLALSRLWHFQVGSSRWIARAYITCFFHPGAAEQRGGTVFAIYFEGKGSKEALEQSALYQDLRARLAGTNGGNGLVWKLPSESRPSRLLGELDRISAAFGSMDRHRVPPSRSRTVSKRLAAVADAVLAHGTWNLEGPTLWLWDDGSVVASISPMRDSGRGRAEMSSMLMVFDGTTPNTPHEKLQPLSLRGALAEARFLEAAFASARKR